MHSNRLNSLNRNQLGSALLVAMVMIFMLSLMGVSAMRGSTLEKRMAINAIQSSATFQAAESASELALNTPANLSNAYQQGMNTELFLEIDEVHENIGMESASVLEYVGDNGLPAGFSVGIVASVIYVSSGVSAIPAVRSQSTVEQGAYRVVPAR
ncbi:MAG: PilX N-terminal domain-containing pilus assembly protein [Granulosicoccus sp.]